jgi:hypothetical protein
MRSGLLTVALTGALTLLGSSSGLAQEATPATPGAGSPFAELGLPELTVTATNEGLSVDQAEIPAGRYLIKLDNQTDNPLQSSGFVRLTDDLTLDDLTLADEIAAGTPIPPGGPDPAQFGFLYETLIVPGASALSPEIVADLPAGEYGIWPDDPAGQLAIGSLTVTGEEDAEISGPEPEAAVTIFEEGEGGAGYAFRLEGELSAGPQVVKVVNDSDQPHFMEADQYPEPITLDQFMSSMMFDPSTGATPSPDMLDFSQLSLNGWASAQSTGTTQWVVLDLEPGQVILSCWVPDPLAGGAPHAMEGMIQLFDVAG